MLSRNWTRHPQVIFEWPTNALEDFAVEQVGTKFRATFTAGPNLQDQRAFHAYSDSPLGPFEEVESAIKTHAMTRLDRSRLDKNRRIVAQVWPGLPKCGLWLHTDISDNLTVREVLVPPQKPYDIVAACPGTFNNPDGDVDIAWEGRAKKVKWSLYVGALHPDGSVTTDQEPLCDGANPSYLFFANTVYLYYSAWEGNGFKTWVMHQKISG
jgi:hypothetical protein